MIAKYSYLILFLLLCTKLVAQQDYLNASLPTNERVELLLKQMTLDEKIGQMCQYVGEPSNSKVQNKDEEVEYTLSIGERASLIKEGKIGSFLKVPNYKTANYLQKLAEQSRLKIPLLIATDAIHGHGMYQGAVTIYPTGIGTAATFDTTLAYKIAQYTAHEMRATGYHWSFSPNIEIVRDARWGRTGETFGEDPLLVSAMGKAMIEGYQGNNFSAAGNVLSCAKHFVAGGIAYNGLNGAAADVSMRTLHEIFFPPFVDAINAGAYTIMPAHNEVNGIPCHAHKEFLTDLIRDDWGFKGFFVSDWMDIERLSSVHKIAADEKEAAKLAVLAGLDIHMQGPHFFEYVKNLVQEELIPKERIDDAARKILYAKFQLGLFENRYVDKKQVESTLLKQAHKDLALEAARKSIVLLKNEDRILPLCKEITSVFVTGPVANNQAMLGDWSRIQPDDNITTVLEGIQNIVAKETKVKYLPCMSYDSISSETMTMAIEQAAQADFAIVVVGENSIRFDTDKTTGENLDRPILDLPGNQLDYVKAIESTGTPVIIVLINGGPIASPWMVENVDAIIEAWEPGMFGGQALAEVIFGDYNPGGKMPISVPYTVGHNQSYYNRKPSAYHRGNFYNSQRESLFEFGFGLSYTEFEYSNLHLPANAQLTDDVNVSIELKNTGDYDGDEVVLIYINDIISSVTTPVKKLAAFKRIHLKTGESKKVTFSIPNSCFQLLDINRNQIVEPGEFEIIIGDDIIKDRVTFN